MDEIKPDRTVQAALFCALAKAQAKMLQPKKHRQAEIPGKDGKAGYKYSYADLASVYEAVRPALAAEGLSFFHLTSQDERSVTVTTVLAHQDGGTIETSLSWSVGGRVQDLGSAVTYLRRYTLSALVGVASEEDDDGAAAERGSFEGRAGAAWEKEKKEKKPKEDTFSDEEMAGFRRSFSALCERALGRKMTEDEADVAELALCDSPLSMLNPEVARRKAAAFAKATDATALWARDRLSKRGLHAAATEAA